MHHQLLELSQSMAVHECVGVEECAHANTLHTYSLSCLRIHQFQINEWNCVWIGYVNLYFVFKSLRDLTCFKKQKKKKQRERKKEKKER